MVVGVGHYVSPSVVVITVHDEYAGCVRSLKEVMCLFWENIVGFQIL